VLCQPPSKGAFRAGCLTVCLWAGLPSAAWAQLCPIIQADDTFGLDRGAGAKSATTDDAITASADEMISEDGIVFLNGGAELSYLDRLISAQNAQYNTDTGEVSISGELTLAGDGIELSSSDADFDLDDDRFSTGETRYRIALDGRRATGSADGMSGEPGGKFSLEGATYSTCPPEKLDWYIRADRLSLDTESGVGIAHGLSMRFKEVPIFALPVFSFPIGTQRKTGFLAPAIARSDNTGFEFILPWYWNIRPNLDATLTPRLLTKRGLQLQTEVRYLDTQGEWGLFNETIKDRNFDHQWRSFTRLVHDGHFGSRISSRIDAATVSDNNYFDDLGNNFQSARVTHLERVAELVYEDTWTTAAARLQGFETVDLASVNDDDAPDVTDTPYRRVPQVTLSTRARQQPFGLSASLDGELVYFDRRDSVTGTRIDLSPRLSLPLRGDAWFFEPSISHRLTWYGLNDSGPNLPSKSSRNVNTISLDTGLYFDRIVNNDGTVQTLEPRVYYLKVPFADQENIPVFDSSAFDFNFSQLFRENRYSGADRIADADQLSLALTSRVIDGADGRETLSAAIGQIRYFEDRRVRLPDETFGDGAMVDTRDQSDFVAEVSTRLRRDWLARGNIQWNPDRDETARGSLLVSYQPDDQRILNLGHRVVNTGSRAETEQLDFSVIWPVFDNLRVAARWNYSLDADISLESLLGLEYESCCYALRFAARRYISDDDEQHDTSVYLQLVLKGLAPIGQNYGAIIENAILGYRDIY
jgi:LPS-assembly protein